MWPSIPLGNLIRHLFESIAMVSTDKGGQLLICQSKIAGNWCQQQ